ncbi:Vacuolar calcium ion transporter [Madurella mycetomatis]|uniref:Vacuolar calcium ion transporter n=1 Tax=Madurella mycetomatis TaxID=100816 RepID=A0A175W826_9PEZI|nr:Vacuolar calcium ion transporter [Madurella mycetomatis]
MLGFATGDCPTDQRDIGNAVELMVAIISLAIAFCAEYMVNSVSALTAGHSAISAEFVWLILLPIVGNAAEHATAVTVAVKDKMDLVIGVVVGLSMQIALFVIPLLVAVLFVAMFPVNYFIADGKSHWLEGMLLICLDAPLLSMVRVFSQFPPLFFCSYAIGEKE